MPSDGNTVSGIKAKAIAKATNLKAKTKVKASKRWLNCWGLPGVPKNGPLVYFDDNVGKYGPILTIFSLLQQEIYDAQN